MARLLGGRERDALVQPARDLYGGKDHSVSQPATRRDVGARDVLLCAPDLETTPSVNPTNIRLKGWGIGRESHLDPALGVVRGGEEEPEPSVDDEARWVVDRGDVAGGACWWWYGGAGAAGQRGEGEGQGAAAEDTMVVVEPMVLHMLVVMMLVLAVVMPRRHGSQVLPAAPADQRRPRHDSCTMDLWIYCHLNAAVAHR